MLQWNQGDLRFLRLLVEKVMDVDMCRAQGQKTKAKIAKPQATIFSGSPVVGGLSSPVVGATGRGASPTGGEAVGAVGPGETGTVPGAVGAVPTGIAEGNSA